jgi:hypothetical protein
MGDRLMPTFRFKGFRAASAVALSVGQGAVAASAEVAEWGAAGGGGSLSIVTTSDAEKSATLALVAPTVMWFDAVPSGLGADPVVLPPLDYASTPMTSTTNLIYDPAFHEVYYFWKLTTTPAGFRTTYHSTDYNMPTAWNDRRIAYGQKVAFCFDEPGAYTLECFAVGPTGTTATSSTSFTIIDPDDAYSGSATYAVNPSGDSDFSWAPAGATQFNTGATDRDVVANMLTTYCSGTTSRRILFKPGAAFNMRGAEIGNWNNGGDTRLRHYVGSPLGETPAIFDLGTTANGPKFNNDGDHASVTVSNLEFVGPFDPDAMVPKSGDGFRRGYDGIDELPPWQLGLNDSLTTHGNFFHIKMRDMRGQYLRTPFWRRGDRGVGPRIAFAECDLNYSNYQTAWFQNYSRNADNSVIPENEPRFKIAFIGFKLVAPPNAKEFCNHGYTVTNGMWPIRFSFLGELYMAACDLHIKTDTIDPIIRAHSGAFAEGDPRPRAGWQYITFDRVVGEGVGHNGFVDVGTREDAGSNPCNVMLDKILWIGTERSGHRFLTGGDVIAAGTYRNIMGVIPPSGEGTTFFSSGFASNHGANEAYDLAHPRRIHNVTMVSVATNGNIGYIRPFMESPAISALPDLRLENNILHYPNQTLDLSLRDNGPFTSGLLAGVTPRYPGRNDVQAMWVPTELTGVSIANNGTFNIRFLDMNSRNTERTNRPYAAATQAYWTANPTHNFHYIRQGSTYHYVFNGGLQIVSVNTDSITFRNTTGGTLTGDWEIWIDRRGLHPGPQASTATPKDLPLSWIPTTGSPAIPSEDLGLHAVDDFFGRIRTVARTRGAFEATD